MNEKGISALKFLLSLYATDFMKGCPNYTRQLDPRNGKTIDICTPYKDTCRFNDGQYQTRADTEPVGNLSQYDCGIAEGTHVGLCRFQEDAVHFGRITLFDKKWLRPTPRDK